MGKTRQSGRTILLDIHNFHALFGDKQFQVGDRVRGLNEFHDWDLLIGIEEDPTYTLTGISKQKDGIIVERKYIKAEHVMGKEIGRYETGSPKWREYDKMLQKGEQ